MLGELFFEGSAIEGRCGVLGVVNLFREPMGFSEDTEKAMDSGLAKMIPL